MTLYTVLTWGLGVPLIYKYGFIGIAIAGLIITYSTLPIVVREMNKVVKVDTFNSIKKSLFASIIMAIITFFINKAITRDLLTLSATIVLGGLIYSAIMYKIDREYLQTEFKSWVGMIGKGKNANKK